MASAPQTTDRTAGPERPAAPAAPSAAPTAKRPGKATASLVLGIIGVLVCWIPLLAIILGVLAIVFGAGVRNDLRGKLPGRGMATAGLVLGVVAVVLGVAIWIINAAAVLS